MKSGDGCTISDKRASGRVQRAAGQLGREVPHPAALARPWTSATLCLCTYNVRCSAWDMAAGSCNCGMAHYFICRSVRLFDSNQTNNERWWRVKENSIRELSETLLSLGDFLEDAELNHFITIRSSREHSSLELTFYLKCNGDCLELCYCSGSGWRISMLKSWKFTFNVFIT